MKPCIWLRFGVTFVVAALGAGAPLTSGAAQSVQATPAVSLPVTATANINLTPRRVIFDRNKRSEVVYVFNQGNVAVTVDVALIDNVMLPSGEIVPLSRVAEKGPSAIAAAATVKSARPFLITAPSRLTLPPGQGRAIRIRATLPEPGAVAEYRTHLTVTTVPPPDSGLTADQAAAAGRGELVLRVQSIFGVSIPLIVRSAAPSTTASLGSIGLSTEGAGGSTLVVPLARQGNGSVYGNLEVRDGKGRNGQVIGLVRGVAVYPELAERQVKIPLVRAPRSGEALLLTYHADDGNAGSKLASRSFIVP